MLVEPFSLKMARIRVLQQAQALYLRQNAVVGFQRYNSSHVVTNFEPTNLQKILSFVFLSFRLRSKQSKQPFDLTRHFAAR